MCCHPPTLSLVVMAIKYTSFLCLARVTATASILDRLQCTVVQHFMPLCISGKLFGLLQYGGTFSMTAVRGWVLFVPNLLFRGPI